MLEKVYKSIREVHKREDRRYEDYEGMGFGENGESIRCRVYEV